MQALWPWVLVGAIAISIVTTWITTVRRRHRTIATLGAILEDAVIDRDRGVVTGRIDGRHVRAELTSRGDGSSAESWTEVRIGIASTLALELRPQTLAERIDVKRGLAVDVIIGDDAFDAAYIIEGAPSDTVRDVFADPEVRRVLVHLSPCEVTKTRGEMLIAKKGWLYDDALASITQAAGLLALRIEKFGDTNASRLAEGDVAALERAREMRKHSVRTRTLFFLLIVFAMVVVFVLMATFHKG